MPRPSPDFNEYCDAELAAARHRGEHEIKIDAQCGGYYGEEVIVSPPTRRRKLSPMDEKEDV